MTKTAPWITEILETLRSFGAQVDPIDLFSYHADSCLLVFIPATLSMTAVDSSAILIHEDLFHTRKSQLVMRLKSQLGLNEKKVHGRSTRVAEIAKAQAEKFVSANHLMGFVGGTTFLGLFHKNVLVAVAVFSRIRLMKYENPPYYSVEMERYCSLADTTVVGGLDKLIKHYQKQYQVDDIVTSVDLEGSTGISYLNLGFEEIERTAPLIFAIDKDTFRRRLITTISEQKPNEYIIQNRGNIKLRKWINKPAE